MPAWDWNVLKNIAEVCWFWGFAGPIQFKSAPKIWPLLELLAKIRWVLAHARKVFATARMLRFSLKFPYGKTEKHIAEKSYECFWKHASSFCWRFIETDARNNSSRKATAKVESNIETWRR